MKKGVPISPGVAVARAYCVDQVLLRREPSQLDTAALSAEVSRFDAACAAAGRELDAIVERVTRQVGEAEAAILARSLGIPAVSGLRGILREVQTGDLVALDGREGHVYLHPGPEVEAAYRKLQREYVDLRDSLIENRDQAPVTADGIEVELL